jgi:hypothetical protein
MKTRVVARAFYEDAYLDFFIKYYLAIGFDEIVILKADTDPEYNLPEYKLPDELTEEQKCRVVILPVKNTGNRILQEHYDVFINEHPQCRKDIDWVLNIDCDEFLILDWEKYPGGIGNYLDSYLQELEDNSIVDNKDQVQQIKYRWMCITKLDNKFQNQTQTIKTYLDNYPMEVYRYVKSLGAVKHLISKKDAVNDNSRINCHFYLCNSQVDELKKSNNEILHKLTNIYLLDGQYSRVNNSDPRRFRKDKAACVNGFILHVNTRSLSNALTKCLVTQLRSNKKIKGLGSFKNWVSSFQVETLDTYLIDSDEKYKEEINKIKTALNKYLNSKYFFPMKIKKYNNVLKKYLDEELLSELVNKKCLGSELLCSADCNAECNTGITSIISIPFVNQDLENKILEGLCKEKGIDYEKLMKIMGLY